MKNHTLTSIAVIAAVMTISGPIFAGGNGSKAVVEEDVVMTKPTYLSFVGAADIAAVQVVEGVEGSLQTIFSLTLGDEISEGQVDLSLGSTTWSAPKKGNILYRSVGEVLDAIHKHGPIRLALPNQAIKEDGTYNVKVHYRGVEEAIVRLLLPGQGYKELGTLPASEEFQVHSFTVDPAFFMAIKTPVKAPETEVEGKMVATVGEEDGIPTLSENLNFDDESTWHWYNPGSWFGSGSKKDDGTSS